MTTTGDDPDRGGLFAAGADRRTLRAFGAALAEERTDRGLTQVIVARRAGISQAAVSDIENGLENPRLTTVVAIAYALQMSPAHLLAAIRNRPPQEPQP